MAWATSGVAVAVLTAVVATGCASQESRPVTSDDVIGQSVRAASGHHPRSVAVATLPRSVSGSSKQFTGALPDQDESWTVLVACPAPPGKIDGSDVTFGAVPTSSVTKALLAQARRGGFDKLVPACADPVTLDELNRRETNGQ